MTSALRASFPLLLIWAANADAASPSPAGADNPRFAVVPLANGNETSGGLLAGDKLQFDAADPRALDDGGRKLVVGAVVCGVGVLILLDSLLDFVVAGNSYSAGDTDNGNQFRDLGYLSLVIGSVAAAVGFGVLIWALMVRSRWAEAMKKAGLQVGARGGVRASAPTLALAMRW